MKVLVVSTLYPPVSVGGAELAASRLAEAIVRAGHEVTVVCLHPKQNRTVEFRNGVKVYREPLENVYWPFQDASRPSSVRRLIWHLRDLWNWKAARGLARILEIERPDLLHTHNVTGFSVSVWNEAKRRKLPIVHTVHDYHLLCINGKLFRGNEVCNRRCIGCKSLTQVRKRSSGAVNAVVAVSSHTLSEHTRRKYFENASAEVIYNIVAPRMTATCTYDRGTGDLAFGFIGRLSPDKGIEILLRAFQALRGTQCRLRIAGSGDKGYVNKLRERYNDPRIEWLGFIDPDHFYHSVDVVVIPSIWADPLPYVCVEALRAGNGIICANSGGLPEIASLGEAVAVVAPGNVDSLANALRDALGNPPHWRRRRARGDEQLQVFEEKAVLERYLRVYESVTRCPSGVLQPC